MRIVRVEDARCPTHPAYEVLIGTSPVAPVPRWECAVCGRVLGAASAWDTKGTRGMLDALQRRPRKVRPSDLSYYAADEECWVTYFVPTSPPPQPKNARDEKDGRE